MKMDDYKLPISIFAGVVIGMVLFGFLDARLFHGVFRTGFLFVGAIAGAVAGFFAGSFLGDLLEEGAAW